MHPRSLVMVFTLILMIIFSDPPSTHATLHARSTIMHKIVVLGATTVQTLANRARIAWLRRKSVLMLIAMVGRVSSHSSFLWQADFGSAFDDQTSTFIIPSGGGFEVVFCPKGRSSNILAVYSKQLDQLSQSGHVSAEIISDAQNITLQRINSKGSRSGVPVALSATMGAMVTLCLWV